MQSKYSGYTRIACFAAALLITAVFGRAPEAAGARSREPVTIRSQDGGDAAKASPAFRLCQNMSHGLPGEDPADRTRALFTERNEHSRERLHRRWQETPPEDRRQLERRMEEWNRLSPGEREQYRKRFQQYRRLSPEEQRRLQQDLDRWENLSPRERESIRRKFQ